MSVVETVTRVIINFTSVTNVNMMYIILDANADSHNYDDQNYLYQSKPQLS